MNTKTFGYRAALAAALAVLTTLAAFPPPAAGQIFSEEALAECGQILGLGRPCTDEELDQYWIEETGQINIINAVINIVQTEFEGNYAISSTRRSS